MSHTVIFPVQKILKPRSSICVVPGCKMRLGTNLLSEVRLVRFPMNPLQRKLWEEAIDRKNWKSTKYSYVCSRHFITGKSSRNPEHPDYVPSVFECEKDSKVSSKESYLRYLKNLGVCDYEDNSCTENEPYKSPLILRLNGTASSETDSSEETANLCKPIKEKSATTMTELSMQDIKHIEKQNIIYKSQIEFYKRLIKIKSSFSPKYSL